MELLIKRSAFFISLMMLGFFVGSSQAYKFFVGGKDGWVVGPSENYNHWAERMRFQVNDTLYFKYRKGADSVLVVETDDYFSCNVKKPLKSLTDGESVFSFDHSGPQFFISGHADNCNKGQKLFVVVMAVRNKTHHQAPPPATVPSPSSSSSPPPVESPKNTSASPPTPSGDNDSPLPAPAPVNSGAAALGLSVGVSFVLGSFLLNWLH